MGLITSQPSSQQQHLTDATGILEELPPLEEVPYTFSSCNICLEEVRTCVLECGHTLCQECIQSQLRFRWPGNRITFGYLRCGICRAPLAHESITQQLRSHTDFQEKVAEVALTGARENGLLNDLYNKSYERGEILSPEYERQYATDRMVVCQCSECQMSFCAGLAECAQLMDTQMLNQKPRCSSCIWKSTSRAQSRKCEKHGPQFAIYKCDFCCSLAVWQCGCSHFCEPCHGGQPRKHFHCSGPEDCPLGIAHPPNGPSPVNFVFGCSGCAGCLDENEECLDENEEYTGSDYGDDFGGDDYLDFDVQVEFLEQHSLQHCFRRDSKRAKCKLKKARCDKINARKRNRSQEKSQEFNFLSRRQRKYKAFLLDRSRKDFCMV